MKLLKTLQQNSPIAQMVANGFAYLAIFCTHLYDVSLKKLFKISYTK